MDLYEEFFKVIAALNEDQTPYLVVGGIAMAFHDEPRFTRDIDFACPVSALEEFERAVRRVGFFRSTEPWQFPNTAISLHRFIKVSGEDHLLLDLLVSAEHPFLDMFGKAVTDSSGAGAVRIVSKEDLVWLKSLRGSDQDQVDIRRLENDANRENGQGGE